MKQRYKLHILSRALSKRRAALELPIRGARASTLAPLSAGCSYRERVSGSPPSQGAIAAGVSLVIPRDPSGRAISRDCIAGGSSLRGDAEKRRMRAIRCPAARH